MKIGKQVVELGDFLAYSPVDVHLSPEFYPDPFKYDPGRWLQPWSGELAETPVRE